MEHSKTVDKFIFLLTRQHKCAIRMYHIFEIFKTFLFMSMLSSPHSSTKVIKRREKEEKHDDECWNKMWMLNVYFYHHRRNICEFCSHFDDQSRSRERHTRTMRYIIFLWVNMRKKKRRIQLLYLFCCSSPIQLLLMSIQTLFPSFL